MFCACRPLALILLYACTCVSLGCTASVEPASPLPRPPPPTKVCTSSFWAMLPELGFAGHTLQTTTYHHPKFLDFVVFSQASGILIDECIQARTTAKVADDLQKSSCGLFSYRADVFEVQACVRTAAHKTETRQLRSRLREMLGQQRN